MTTNQERRDRRAKTLTPEFIMGDVHEDVFKSVFARSVHTYGNMATRQRPFPPVTTYRLDKMSGFSEVNPKTIGNILRALYDWGFLTPFVRANKTRASITPKGWAYLFFYLNRSDFGLDIFTPFAEAAVQGPRAFAAFVRDTGLPDQWFHNLCRDVWVHEESFVPEERRRPWPWSAEGGSVPSEAGVFMPCLGNAPSAGQEIEEHPIDAIIETRSPRMTDEEVEALYLKRAEDPAQVEIARVMLAREYRKDTRFADMQEVNGLIKQHLTPVETLRFEHRRMWEGPAVGIETLVERMSKAGQFKPTTLADMAPNRLGISDMDAPGHGVSKIAAALRLEDEAAAARNLGAGGQTTLGEAGITLTPPEPAGDAETDRAQALRLAVEYLGRQEPGDSRAVSNEFVAMAAASCGIQNEEGRAIIAAELARLEKEPVEPPPAVANYVSGSTWYSGHKLHIVRGEGSDKRALTLCGQPLTVDFIIESDYDEQHVAYLEREVEHLMDKMNLPHGVQYYHQIDEDFKLLHNKRGYTREHQRVGEIEHTVTTVGPVWTDAIVAALLGAAAALALVGVGLWSGVLVFA